MRKTSITIVIMIMTIMLSSCGKNKSEKINEKELEIEQKYGIEIEKVREEDLKVISEYFAKLPDGFVEELKTYQDYEEYQDRKIYIYVSGDGVTDVKNDVSRGDYWILDNNKEIEDQLAYCTMESVSYNISYRKRVQIYCMHGIVITHQYMIIAMIRNILSIYIMKTILKKHILSGKSLCYMRWMMKPEYLHCL